MQNLEDIISDWSLSSDGRAMKELEPYIEDAFDNEETIICECWRGDSTCGHASATKIGEILAYDRATSWSIHEYNAPQFAEFAVDEHGGEKVIYHVEKAELVDISEYSDLATEGEVISSIEAEFEVIDTNYDDYDKTYYIELAQLR